MVDGELWSRFFLLDRLYTVNAVIAGYRSHANNRAKLHYSDCLAEMEKAIATMRPNCSPEVLEDARALGLIKRLREKSILKPIPIQGIARRIFPDIFRRASYPVILYENGKWMRAREDLQFSV